MILEECCNPDKFSEEITKNLERALSYIEAFKEKSKEREKQLQLRVEGLQEEVLLLRERELKAEREKLSDQKRMFYIFNFDIFIAGRKTAVLNRKMIELETKIEAKKTLELEIESMKSDIEVMKQKDIVDDRDMDLIKKKMEALERDVKEKEEKLEEMEKLFGALTAVKERKANDELQDFRQVIINLLKESKPAIIGVKMMGQIDIEAIRTAVEARKLPANTTELLYAKWKRYLVDPKLSRFKIIMDKEGNCKKFSGEIKKNLEKCLLAMDAFEKKSEEREKQLQLRVEELEKQLQLHEEVQFDSEKERFIKPDRMVMNGFVLLPENNILTLEMKFETSEKKMDVVMNDLKKKKEKMQEMEELIKALTVKHCKLDEELQDARKVISIMSNADEANKAGVTANQGRSSIHCFFDAIKIIQPADTEVNSELVAFLSKTPFWVFIKSCLDGTIDPLEHKNYGRSIDVILPKYNRTTNKFSLGGGKVGEISDKDVAKLLGLELKDGMLEISQNNYGTNREKSSILQKYFEKGQRPKKSTIEFALKKAIKYESMSDVARLVIVHLLACYFFTSTSQAISWNLVHLCENLDEIGNYNWAQAINARLSNSLKNRDKSSVSGCISLVAYWFCEKTNIIDPKEGKKDAKPGLAKWNLQVLNLKWEGTEAKVTG
ncbi:hypothetical protein LWI29_031715 [Acer saccharum]|uniref:Aminotransferase-like plant mobile domain-containing protein n=1 Tax=Acer saccharum TaxID=4024 RepID=A0AA39W7Y6_ACESA|nr:hypothetical protein LWI29_031715 [Acer saccharum]